MSEETTVATPADPAATPEPKLGKPKLAKAKKAAPKVEGEAGAAPAEAKVPRPNPYAGKRIFLNRANEAIGAEGKNPKRPGSNGHQAFSMYEDGRTVADQLEFWKTVMVTTKSGKQKPVGDVADIRWDVAHGFIELRAE